ncbi:dihydropteroate synthase [Halorarius halobius]|uniref:dihydropteroate synthase n=1 Tax=Halorarius halobius TaxID=2962671 RepID=UPI0020CC0CC0|nr:dihydropteroate synthase [Halorarius halobius]
MQYHEAASWLFDLRRYSPRTGVEHTRHLLDALDSPDEEFRCVQIAGSNGKGSTARMLERVLREAGLDVGLFTSPHLDDVRERVRVNGRKMPKSAVCEFVETVDGYVTDRAAADESPTFFETVTGMALWEFARQEVDVAVLEVGIGGRHDATSAVDPAAGAITSVTIEHADLLGDTEADIARDMAHVAADRPLVTAATGEALDAIESSVDDVYRVGEDGDLQVEYGGREGLEGAVSLSADDWAVETRLPLLGAHQARNAGVAAALARQVADVSDADLARGLRNAHWPGRFEVFDRDPLVVLDGAHNPGGCAGLADALAEFDYDDLHLVFGAMADKDHAGMAAALPEAATVYTCRPDFDRAERPAVLAESFEARADDVRAAGNVADALADALEAAGPDDAVVVAGSLFVVAEARRRWTAVDVPKRVPGLDTAEAVLEDADVTDAGVWRMRGKGVHRVLRTRVQPRQARYLKQEMLAEGGECATSGLSDQDRELVDIVLMGTLAQFKRLTETLAGQPYGLEPLGERLRETLDIRTDPETHGYPWEEGTAVMGILNVTPDSFHDGGEYDAVEDAVARAERMVADGADIVDVGGESTRPGADPVPVEAETERVVPVVERLRDLDALVSVDTRKAEVARAALEAGADVLNDVSGLEDPEMRLVAAEHDVPVVVMHSIETPVDPATAVEYDDVVEDTIDALVERVLLAEKAGLDRSQILVDPGIGFGKTKRENFELLGRIDEFHALGCPVLVGHSHKSLFDLLGYDADDRLHATVGASAVAADRGADVLRVHDVAENVAAVRVAEAADDPDGA